MVKNEKYSELCVRVDKLRGYDLSADDATDASKELADELSGGLLFLENFLKYHKQLYVEAGEDIETINIIDSELASISKVLSVVDNYSEILIN
jgi:hypothetical protein